MKGRRMGTKSSAAGRKAKQPVTNKRVSESIRYLNKDAFRTKK